MNPQTPEPLKGFEGIAVKFTEWIGSPSSLLVHTILFIISFALVLFGIPLDTVLLVLTTVVSLEAIYLAIFIQMSVNRQARSIQGVEEDIDEIQEDIDEIQEDVEDIEEDIDEIQVDVDEIQEDVEDMTEAPPDITLNNIYADLKKLVDDVEKFKQQNSNKSH